MDAIEVAIAKYVEDHSDIALNYEHDWRTLDEKLVNARRNLDSLIDQFKYSFEQNFREQISEEAFAQVIAKKLIGEQEIQVIESDIAQLKQNFHLYCTFRRAMSEKSACEEIVSINLKKATVKSDGSVDVLFF